MSDGEKKLHTFTADKPAAEVTRLLYEHDHGYFLELIGNLYKHNGKIVILGGIQINAEPWDDFEPRLFFVIEPNGVQKDLLENIF